MNRDRFLIYRTFFETDTAVAGTGQTFSSPRSGSGRPVSDPAADATNGVTGLGDHGGQSTFAEGVGGGAVGSTGRRGHQASVTTGALG